MNALAQQLLDPVSAGSYTLQCDEKTLVDAVQGSGLKLLEADLKGVKGKQNFLSTMAQAGAFPKDFGVNWDAFADELCDLSWHGDAGFVLLLRNVSDTLGLSAHDREIALDIFADTVVYWRQRKKPFWIFFA
jgi:hypothetical protein